MTGRKQSRLKRLDLARLLELARSASRVDAESDERWQYVWELRSRDPDAVMAICAALLKGGDIVERELAADLMPCGWNADENLCYPRKAYAVVCLAKLLDDPAPEVVSSAIYSLSRMDAAMPLIGHREDLARHASPWVRLAMASCLNEDDPASGPVAMLQALTRDDDKDVRDWATFSLGSICDADSPDIRSALVERLTDEDEETRLEAMVGLARRHDLRTLPMVRAELDRDDVCKMAIEAAGSLALPELVAPLEAIREWWPDCEDIDEAIARCRGMGDPERDFLWSAAAAAAL